MATEMYFRKSLLNMVQNLYILGQHQQKKILLANLYMSLPVGILKLLM